MANFLSDTRLQEIIVVSWKQIMNSITMIPSKLFYSGGRYGIAPVTKS